MTLVSFLFSLSDFVAGSLAGAAFQGKTGRTSSSAFQDCSQTPSLVVIHEFDCLQQVLFGAPGSGNWIFQETATALGQRFYQRILCNGVSISRNNNGVFREMVTGCIRKMTAFGQQLNLDVLCSGMGVFKKRWQPCVNSFTWVFCAMVWVFSGNGDGPGSTVLPGREGGSGARSVATDSVVPLAPQRQDDLHGGWHGARAGRSATLPFQT